MTLRTRKWIHLLFILMITQPLVSQMGHTEMSGKTQKKETLRKSPSTSSPVASELEAEAEVGILRRAGGWYEVQSGAKRGFLPLFSVKLGGNQSSGALADTANNIQALAKRTQVSKSSSIRNVTQTSGVRGLDASELKDAKPDPAQVALLETFAATPEVAKQFADDGKLKSQSIQIKEAK